MEDIEQVVEEAVERRLALMSRRNFLAAAAGIAGAGALGYLGGRVTADPSQASGTVYLDQIGSMEYPVKNIYADTMNVNEGHAIFEELTVTDELLLPEYESNSGPPIGASYWNTTEKAAIMNEGSTTRYHGVWRPSARGLEPDAHDTMDIGALTVDDVELYIQSSSPADADIGDVWVDTWV